jgi:hypothetical protein
MADKEEQSTMEDLKKQLQEMEVSLMNGAGFSPG